MAKTMDCTSVFESTTLKILEGYSDVIPFLEDICRESDAHRNALGFVPRSLFEEFARREQLYVLIEKSEKASIYLGHLMFRRRFPRAQVLQMFTIPSRRRAGLAATLLNHLRDSLTNDGFMSIYARVAEDLIDANVFWDRQKFYIQRAERGGSTKNRHILVRYHELSTPQLFPASGINAENPLGMVSGGGGVPLYLLDLNVLYDIAPRRLRREDALGLFQAERMNFCHLAVSSEASEELRRTAYPGKTDPMEAYISIFSSLPFYEDASSENILSELSKIVFPTKERLRPNDESDLKHLATAIQNKASGFITNDTALLNSSSELQEKYGIDVLSPAAFSLDTCEVPLSSEFLAPTDVTFSLRELMDPEEPVVRELLSRLTVSSAEIARGWLPIGAQKRLAARYAVWNNATLDGYITWSGLGGGDSVSIRAAINEQSVDSAHVAQLLLTIVMESLARHGPRKLTMEFPARQATLRDLAIAVGFRSDGMGPLLAKAMLGRVVTPNSWSLARENLAVKCGIKLPASIPIYRSGDQFIEVLTPNGNRSHISLNELETLLSPALLCLPGRPAVITPVRRTFSEHLLMCTPQDQLFPQASASLYQERHYMSDSRTIAKFKRGTLILFYESLKHRGRGEIVAIARVRESYLKPDADLASSDFAQSVLSPETVSAIGKAKIKTVTVFDSIFSLPKPITYRRLKELGCGKPNDLITTHAISDNQFQKILVEAFGSD